MAERRVRVFIESVAEEAGRTATLHSVSGAFLLIELDPVTTRQRADPLLDEFSFDEEEISNVAVDPRREEVRQSQARAIAESRAARLPSEIRRAAAKVAGAGDRRIDLDSGKK